MGAWATGVLFFLFVYLLKGARNDGVVGTPRLGSGRMSRQGSLSGSMGNRCVFEKQGAKHTCTHPMHTHSQTRAHLQITIVMLHAFCGTGA